MTTKRSISSRKKLANSEPHEPGGNTTNRSPQRPSIQRGDANKDRRNPLNNRGAADAMLSESVLASRLCNEASFVSTGLITGSLSIGSDTSGDLDEDDDEENLPGTPPVTWISYTDTDSGQLPFVGSISPSAADQNRRTSSNIIRLPGLGNVKDARLQLALWHDFELIGSRSYKFKKLPTYSQDGCLPRGQLVIRFSDVPFRSMLSELAPESSSEYQISYAVIAGEPPISISAANRLAHVLNHLEGKLGKLYRDATKVHYDLKVCLFRLLLSYQLLGKGMAHDINSMSVKKLESVLDREFRFTRLRSPKADNDSFSGTTASSIHQSIECYGRLLYNDFELMCPQEYVIELSSE